MSNDPKTVSTIYATGGPIDKPFLRALQRAFWKDREVDSLDAPSHVPAGCVRSAVLFKGAMQEFHHRA